MNNAAPSPPGEGRGEGRALILALLLLLSSSAFAAPPRLASVTWENDFLAGFDYHYTNGFQVAVLVDVADLPGGLRSIPPMRWSVDRRAVLAVGQRIYTPTDTLVERPARDDRPYAGWLYLLTDVQTRSGETIDHVTASIGLVGPASLAQEFQDGFHALTGTSRNRGWDYQVRNELTVMLGYERAWPRVAQGRFAGGEVDLALRAGGALGNALTYASAGAVLRYGSNLPSDLPVTHVSLGPPRDGFRGAADAFGWYAWGGVDARAVGRNIFIEGRTFGNASDVELEPFGYDLQLGIAAVWPTARVGFTLVRRSREFDTQARPDYFGQLAVSFAY